MYYLGLDMLSIQYYIRGDKRVGMSKLRYSFSLVGYRAHRLVLMVVNPTEL